MAQIKNGQELLRALPQGFRAEELETKLAQKGLTLAPELANGLKAARAKIASRADATRKAKWKQAVQALGPVTVIGAPPPSIVARRDAGDYDVIAAVDLTAISDVLAGLHASRTIPHAIDLPRVISSAELRKFIVEVLQAGFTGVPQGETTTILRLNIEGASAVAVVPNTNRIRLAFPFSVDVSGGTPAGVVKLKGTMSFNIVVTAQVNLDKINLSVAPTDPPPSEGALKLTISPQSQIQPKSASFLHSVEVFLGAVIVRFLKPDLLSKSLSAFITIPSFSKAQLLVRQIDVRAQTRGAGGVVVVGARIGGAQPEPGDPKRLTEPFGTHGGNVFLRIHQELVREALRKAQQTGELERLAREQEDAARIDSADAEFSPSEIRIIIRGHMVDACGFNLDAPFVSTMSFKFRFDANKITISRDVSVAPDWDRAGTYLCILASLVEGALVGVLTGIFLGSVVMGIVVGVLDLFGRLPTGQRVFDLVKSKVFGGGGGDGLPDLVVDLNDPIPGTERLPQVAVSDLQVTTTTQQIWSTVSLVPDTLNTHVYVRFLQTTPFFPKTSSPVSGKSVQMFDQDKPRPAGDDSRLPEESEKETITPKFIITETVQFVPPFGDQPLGSATTGFEGIAHFVISRLSSTAGLVVTTKTTEDIHAHTEKTTSRTEPVTEARPDLYFIMAANGVTVDTRKLPGGLLLNAGTGGRVGTADNPVTFSFTAPLVTVP